MPITLFDKSFLQSLSIDESMWFDNFFFTNVCPSFYIETLADLSKRPRQGRTAEFEVKLIADRHPQLHGGPNAHYRSICISELHGEKVSLEGRIMRGRGRIVELGGSLGVVFEESPEQESANRWGEGEFYEVEKRFAREWREQLEQLDITPITERLKTRGINAQTFKSLAEVRDAVSRIVTNPQIALTNLYLACDFLGVPPARRIQLAVNLLMSGDQPFSSYAPYTSHVLSVELFYYFGVASGHMSQDGRMDMSYLFYLPFCSVFVSTDNLHRRAAPLFLRADQEFVWGDDLKRALAQLNVHYSALPAATKEKGIFSFAIYPPTNIDSLVAALWDRHMSSKWREQSRTHKDMTQEISKRRAELIEHVKKHAEAPPAQQHLRPDDAELESMTIKRKVRKVKGSWYQLPKDLKHPQL